MGPTARATRQRLPRKELSQSKLTELDASSDGGKYMNAPSLIRNGAYLSALVPATHPAAVSHGEGSAPLPVRIAVQQGAVLPTPEELYTCLVAFIPSLAAVLGRRFTPDVAEEALQEALLIAIAAIQSGMAGRHPNRKGWLVRVGINKGNAILRCRPRVSSLGNPGALPGHPDRHESFQECAAVLDALGAIPDDDRLLLERLYFCGLTEREAAEAFGISQSTLRRRRQPH